MRGLLQAHRLWRCSTAQWQCHPLQGSNYRPSKPLGAPCAVYRRALLSSGWTQGALRVLWGGSTSPGQRSLVGRAGETTTGPRILPDLDDHSTPFTIKRATDGYTMTVPPLPPLGDSVYSIPTKNAHVSLPAECASALGMAPNMADKDGTLQGRETMWLGRIGRIGGSVAGLARHANGVVLFACGSGGTAGINVRYMRMLASLGFIVLSPDTMSYEPQLGLRHRRPKQEPDLSDYWSLNPLYQSGCSWPAKGGPSNAPFCYSSEAANITASPESWKRYYQRVYALRERELDFVVGAWEELVGQQEKVFLMGHSEGGMVVGRYSSPTLDRMLSGRIISAWSGEPNYFVPGREALPMARRGRWPSGQPLLSIIGTEDRFFGAANSVAAAVREGTAAFGTERLTGSAYKTMTEGGLTRATSVTVVGAAHDISQVADNLLRSILASFVADPSGFHAAGGGWARCCVRRAGGAAPMSPREFLCRDDTDPGVFAFDGPLLSRR